MSFPDPNANSFDPVQPPRKGSPVVKIIIILAIVFGVLGLICAGLCGWGMYAGMNMVGEQLAIQFRDNPVVVEHIGVIEDCTMNVKAMMELAEEAQAAGGPVQQATMVFDIRGDKGEGQLILVTPQGPQPGQAGPFSEGTLQMSTGEEYDLMLGPVEVEAPELAAPDVTDTDVTAPDVTETDVTETDGDVDGSD